MTYPQRVERYQCPVCYREWDQLEQWSDDHGDYVFCAEPYGFCRSCKPSGDTAVNPLGDVRQTQLQARWNR